MAKKSDILKFKKKQKYTVRQKNRCNLCGRSRAYMRKFGICRICFRELASKGQLPGIVKASW
jgi:small subunit ribosomal protein S14